MITRFTITGADNSVQPGSLLTLSKRFPFVEWGILISSSNSFFGSPRFPSYGWIDDLDIVKIGNPELKLSLHGCGRYVKDLVEGTSSRFFEDMFNFLPNYDRIQLNTHNLKHLFHADFVKLIQYPDFKGKEFIFQYDEANYEVVQQIVQYSDANCSILFDQSGGRGVLPGEWPSPIKDIKCGYAGGLSPENLREQIERIEEKAGDTPVWIDMETHVRSNDDKLFDLDKVALCLEIASPYIKTVPA